MRNTASLSSVCLHCGCETCNVLLMGSLLKFTYVRTLSSQACGPNFTSPTKFCRKFLGPPYKKFRVTPTAHSFGGDVPFFRNLTFQLRSTFASECLQKQQRVEKASAPPLSQQDPNKLVCLSFYHISTGKVLHLLSQCLNLGSCCNHWRVAS